MFEPERHVEGPGAARVSLDPAFRRPGIGRMPGMNGMSRGVRGIAQFGVAAGVACLGIALAGPANADDLNTTTCSDQQIMSSLQKNDPMIWGMINGNPKREEELRVGLAVVLAAPVGQRQQQINTLEQTLGQQQWMGISDDIMNSSVGPVGRAVNNCHGF